MYINEESVPLDMPHLNSLPSTMQTLTWYRDENINKDDDDDDANTDARAA